MLAESPREQSQIAPIFEERQKMDMLWIRIAGAVPLVASVAIFGWGIYHQVIRGQPWGNKQMSNTALILISIFAVASASTITVALFAVQMRTQVLPNRVVVRYRPFRTRAVAASEIEAASAITYRPIRDFGGWGIRRSARRNAWIYSMTGNQAVDLTLDGDVHLYIGTRRPAELESAIRRIIG